MNIEEIDKWLDNEYGVSYTRLEELHDFYFEKYCDLKEENKQLKEHIEKYEHYCKTTGIEELMKENKKYKEVIDKLKKHCETEINASNHYLENHSSQKELCHKVAHQRILDILKEVE